MGRRRQGWTLRQRTPGGVWYVYFTCEARTVERSTGTSESGKAAREAERIYAAAIAQERPQLRKRQRLGEVQLEEIVAAWQLSIEATHAESTCETWGVYASAHWLDFFASVEGLTSLACKAYMQARLRSVLATTVRKELTALRCLVDWATEHGYVSGVVVPTVPEKATGKKHDVRRRVAAIELSPDEVAAIIGALDAWSTSKKVARFPIRARFVVQYETGLRPALLDRISAPLNYRRGAKVLRITADVDKNRWVREVPLTDLARRELDAVCPDEGLIFGRHDYREHVYEAAKAALGEDRAEDFCAAHLRSARATHLLELPDANLPAVQFLLGHKRVETTGRYVRPSFRAAEKLLKSSR